VQDGEHPYYQEEKASSEALHMLRTDPRLEHCTGWITGVVRDSNRGRQRVSPKAVFSPGPRSELGLVHGDASS